MPFRFRQFTVEDSQSTLRIGTDAMLLGSWSNPENAKRILDIGTGCGVLAMMMAQKSDAVIEAIDLDEPSVNEAHNNFLNSPWPSRLTAIHESLRSFSCRAAGIYDFIISNPPYHVNSLKSPSPRVNQTRHSDDLPLSELAVSANRLLSDDGALALILPPAPAEMFQVMCRENGLYPSRRVMVFPKPGVSVKRVLVQFTRSCSMKPESSELTILDEKGKYTPDYLALTGCFHNF